MEQVSRIWFTPKQKAELWERWKSGRCVADIARALAAGSSASAVSRSMGRMLAARHCIALNGSNAVAKQSYDRGLRRYRNGASARQSAPKCTEMEIGRRTRRQIHG